MLLVSHCDFTGNSAFHVYSIATELQRGGWFPAIAVPRSPRGARDIDRPTFPVLSYRDILRQHLRFRDGGGPDIVHAFTPRAAVRKLTFDVIHRVGCPYLVHLEDNEVAVESATAGDHDPVAVQAFLEGAAGVTAVIDRLHELIPEPIAYTVIWPGYDESLDKPMRQPAAIRRDIGIDDDDLAIVYPGNVHEANIHEVHSLYQAVQRLQERGQRLVLVKSGWNSVSANRLPNLGSGIRDLGWIRRHRVFELLHAADILVQPGGPGPFNDYRFPSKLPEFLASGKPVVLPRTNIGLHLTDHVEALLVERGDADELERKVKVLAADPGLRQRLGERGREFAVRELRWSQCVERLISFYGQVRDPDITTRRSRGSG